LEAARQTLAQAASDSDAILAGNPHNLTQALNLVQTTHRALATILFENGAAPSLGDPVQGLRHAEIALHAAETAFARNPKDAGLRGNLLNAKVTKADMLFASGREEEGLAQNKANVDFINASSDLLLEDKAQLVVYTNYQYGRQLATKDPRGALPWMEGSLAAVLSARAADPANIKMAQWAAIATTTVGHVHWLAGDHQKGQQMMTDGVAQLTSLVANSHTPAGELGYALAEGYRGLGDAAQKDGKLRQALSEYQKGESVYAEDTSRIPDDLDVYPKRAENQLSIAAVEAKLGQVKQASASRQLAIEFADHVLRVHSDNTVAQRMKLKATQSLDKFH
jgi:tetratricopeptide (TPR) repeat protein